jgi:DNA-binding NtrC family response regulator
MAARHQRTARAASEAVLQLFQGHNWPGNVRELRNTLERAVIVCNAEMIEPRHLPPAFGSGAIAVPMAPGDGIHLSVGTTVDEAERQLIYKTLEATHNNKTRAAEILGISLKTLHNKLKEYGAQAAGAPELGG